LLFVDTDAEKRGQNWQVLQSNPTKDLLWNPIRRVLDKKN